MAVNETEPFRYRIDGDRVIVHDTIAASATIGRADGTFDFSFIPYVADFAAFVVGAEAEIARIQGSVGLNLEMSMPEVIHFSAAPWLDFTGLSHARNYGNGDSCPKISVGKVTERGGRLGMPVSVHAHHGLMDGLHVGQFVESFTQRLANHPSPPA